MVEEEHDDGSSGAVLGVGDEATDVGGRGDVGGGDRGDGGGLDVHGNVKNGFLLANSVGFVVVADFSSAFAYEKY